MPQPTVSILMPCHNAALFLPDALDSILAQSLEDWELIVVDDGSTDATPEILAEYARDPRITVQRRPHGGIVASLQDAAVVARAPFLARMDADDISLPGRLEAQLRFLEAHPAVALCGTQVEMIGAELGEGRLRYRDWLNALVTPAGVAREAFIECPVAHPAFCMRREAFEAVGGYQDKGWAEDYDLVLRFLSANHEVANVPEVLLHWRDSSGRLSMRDARYEEAQFRACKRHYLKRLYLNGSGPPLYQWGAGEVGKRWLRDPDAFPIEAVVDIHPRKIGTKIHGVRVIAPDDLPPAGDCRILVAVGAPGARENIREWLDPRGHREGADYRFIA
jgi:glycosyltransferase involved in cell wall biosynthesis